MNDSTKAFETEEAFGAILALATILKDGSDHERHFALENLHEVAIHGSSEAAEAGEMPMSETAIRRWEEGRNRPEGTLTSALILIDATDPTKVPYAKVVRNALLTRYEKILWPEGD